MVVVLTHSLSNIGTNRPQQIVLLIQQGEGNNEPISLLFSMNINQPLLLILTPSPSGASLILKTKIIHRGVSYTIPTCTCGFWCSSFVPCKYIARALNARGLEVLSVNHVHPYHLVQLHPLWDNALKNCKRANYDDFGNSIQGKCNI